MHKRHLIIFANATLIFCQRYEWWKNFAKTVPHRHRAVQQDALESASTIEKSGAERCPVWHFRVVDVSVSSPPPGSILTVFFSTTR